MGLHFKIIKSKIEWGVFFATGIYLLCIPFLRVEIFNFTYIYSSEVQCYRLSVYNSFDYKNRFRHVEVMTISKNDVFKILKTLWAPTSHLGCYKKKIRYYVCVISIQRHYTESIIEFENITTRFKKNLTIYQMDLYAQNFNAYHA